MSETNRAAVRRALVQSCPAPYHRTLDAMCSIGWRTGVVWATVDTVAARARLSRATVVRHRSWLAEHGYVRRLGGGWRGAVAKYAIPALSTATGKVLNGAQNEHHSVGERCSKRAAEVELVGTDVVRVPTTTNAVACGTFAIGTGALVDWTGTGTPAPRRGGRIVQLSLGPAVGS